MKHSTQRDGRQGKGPFVRRSEVATASGRIVDVAAQPLARHTECMVRNGTGADRDRYQVLKIADVLTEPAASEGHYLQHDYFAGITVDQADEDRICVLQETAADGQIRRAVMAGVTVVRLTGAIGKNYATIAVDSHVLVAADEGPCVILYDPGPEDEERFAKVRIDGAGGSNTGVIGVGACGCQFITVGSVDCLGEGDSAAKYVVYGLGALLGADYDAIELSFDSDCTWISDLIPRDCGYGS